MPWERARGQNEDPAIRKAAAAWIAKRYLARRVHHDRYRSLDIIGTIEQDRLRSEGLMVDGPHPVTLFEARITHLGDTRLARFG